MNIRWEFRLGALFLLISIAVYALKTYLLGSESITDTVRYLFNAFGFLFISVFMTSLVINELLALRDKKERKEKTEIIMGTFFSEVGIPLLKTISRSDLDQQTFHALFRQKIPWSEVTSQYNELLKNKTKLDISCLDLEATMQYLHTKREFLLRLLENPVLLKHSEFTELLRALFHMSEELDNRPCFCSLPASDIAHLTGDIVRVYDQTKKMWISHMNYLYENYPYLFSLALRMNPFDPDVDPIVRE